MARTDTHFGHSKIREVLRESPLFESAASFTYAAIAELVNAAAGREVEREIIIDSLSIMVRAGEMHKSGEDVYAFNRARYWICRPWWPASKQMDDYSEGWPA